MKNIFLCSFLLISFTVFGQISVGTGTTKQQNNWRVGGGIGLGFGNNNYFGFSVTPFIGYMIAPQLEGGVKVGYQYGSQKNWKQNLFNFGPYMNYYPVRSLFLRAEYDYYTGNQKYGDNTSISYDESALWVGGGYHTSGAVQMHAGLMYNVLYKEGESMFSNGFRPFVGVSVGF